MGNIHIILVHPRLSYSWIRGQQLDRIRPPEILG